MIDCSRAPSLIRSLFFYHYSPTLCTHTDGNSAKNHNNQPKVLNDICEQLKAGDSSIMGVMIESHINAGRQDIPPEGPKGLKHGVSITDACVDWATTVPMLDDLNKVSDSTFSLTPRL